MTQTTLDISEARTQISSLEQRLRDEQVIKITKHGKDAFAVVNLDYLEAVLETIEIMSDPESFKMFQQSLDDLRNGRTIDHEDLRNEFG